MSRSRSILYPLIILIGAGITNAATFNGSGFTIFDNAGRLSTGCRTVAVSGFTSSVILSSITYKGFTHTSIGDLELRVYMPGAAPPPSVTAGQSFVVAGPPDARPCDLSGDYRFIDTGTQSLDSATDTCGDTDVITPGDYRTNIYGGGTADGATTSLATAPGQLSAAQANGNWLVCAFDFAGGDAGSVGSTQLVFNLPTAAKVSVSGRVLSPNGSSVRGASVSIVDNNGKARTAMTNAFGYFQFSDVDLGEYVMSVASRQFRYAPRVLSIHESISSLQLLPIQ